jgi:hypothetical protein
MTPEKMVNSPVAEYQMPRCTGSSAGRYQEAVTGKNVTIMVSKLVLNSKR